MYSVYVLRSQSCSRLYVGSTSNLERRIQQHNENLAAATKNRGPWRLVYQEWSNDDAGEVFQDRQRARRTQPTDGGR
jgi:predicted GIY-YIG superfamily endonuclease